MEKVKLKRTDLDVPRLSFGTMTFGKPVDQVPTGGAPQEVRNAHKKDPPFASEADVNCHLPAATGGFAANRSCAGPHGSSDHCLLSLIITCTSSQFCPALKS